MKQTFIPMTTVRYYDPKGTYREARFNVKEELEAFERRLARVGGQIVVTGSR